MINVLLVKGAFEELKAVKAFGHAGFAEKGSDIVCASVTALLKAAVLSLKAKGGILKTSVKAEQCGELSFEVISCGKEDYPYLAALFDFLFNGLSSICKEYPSCVSLRVES